jgi:sec-independent protein translocase protein TatC
MLLEQSNFYSHISEIRKRLISLCLLYFIFFIISYLLFETIYSLIVSPLNEALGKNTDFIYTGIAEAFFAKLNLSAKSAFLFLIPALAFHAYRFIEPALYQSEKKIVLYSIISAPSLFFLGLFFVYFLVMPKAFEFFISFQQNSDTYTLNLHARISEYISLVSSLVLAFGIAFQLPIFLIILICLGVISSETLSTKRRYSILIIFIIAGIITPPDVLSQLLLAFPLMALYEITIIISKRIEQVRKNA